MNNESFRDRQSTIGTDGKRVWLYPRVVWGKLTIARNVVAWLLLVFLISAPFIHVNGNQLLLFNVPKREFVIFGLLFFPQDFHLFLLSMITFMVFIALFTVVFGRIFCGWACPQTIFLEFLFRPIERLIEGDAVQRRKLDKQPWNFEKIWKKTLKHLIFYAISFSIANVFLAYIIGSDELIHIITSPVSEHLSGFTAIAIFSGVFYGVFAHFREQVCIIACPYGRMQGVLLDNRSIVVAYDYKRGEPRAPYRKDENRQTAQKGHCVSCQLCVQVCPTGIDIRNGTQLECINCTACIDACNSVMKRTSQPQGLIRYASEKNIAEGEKLRPTVRIIAYSAVLTLLLGVMSFLLATRSDVETAILRTYGMLFQEYGHDRYSNMYDFNVVNKTSKQIPLSFVVESPQGGEIKFLGDSLNIVNAADGVSGKFLLALPKTQLTGANTEVHINVVSDNRVINRITTSFVGPNQ